MAVALFGTGPMAAEYCNVLEHIGVDFDIFGNTVQSCEVFSKKVKRYVQPNGIEYISDTIQNYDAAIIAIPIEKQFELLQSLLRFKISNILVEKPGCLYSHQISQLEKLSRENKSNVFVAYNRRFYSSVAMLKNHISEDGGITSCFFEFTELSDKIAKLNKPSCVLDNWVLCNSTHVLDLFVHLCGYPEELHAQAQGSITWHDPAIFTGSGVTDTNIPYCYLANWNSAGSWRLEVSTTEARYILAPLEKLKVQKRNSFEIKEITPPTDIDQILKPGLFHLVDNFLSGKTDELCDLTEQLKNMNFYNAIVI
ncbi:Gfo/Idh/MocA family oxidoreductase [Octadecabacter sp.]|nr:Gfo/Idh/MocA family oxidoreductase [Octadecabacter sp.]